MWEVRAHGANFLRLDMVPNREAGARGVDQGTRKNSCASIMKIFSRQKIIKTTGCLGTAFVYASMLFHCLNSVTDCESC